MLTEKGEIIFPDVISPLASVFISAIDWGCQKGVTEKIIKYSLAQFFLYNFCSHFAHFTSL